MYLNTSLRLVNTLLVLLHLLYMSWLNFPVDICSKNSCRSFGSLLNWLISSDVNAFMDEGSVTRLALCGVDVGEGSVTGLAPCGGDVEFWGELYTGDDELVLVPSAVTVIKFCDPVRVAIYAFSTSFSSRSSMFYFTNFSVN